MVIARLYVRGQEILTAQRNTIAKLLKLWNNLGGIEKIQFDNVISLLHINLGRLYEKKGNIDSAEECFNKVILTLVQLSETDRNIESERLLEIAYKHIANILESKGKLESAEKSRCKSGEIAVKIAIETGRDIDECLNLLSLLWWSYLKLGEGYEIKNDFTEAERYYKKSVDIAEHRVKLSGSNETNFVDLEESYEKIGRVCKSKGDIEEAEEYHDKYLTVCELFVDTCGDLLWSDFLETSGKVNKGHDNYEFYEATYARKCEVLGEKNPDTLASLKMLAEAYDECGEREKALELYMKVYALRCEVLGENHRDTLVSLNNLAHSYDNLGDHQKAQELWGKLIAIIGQ